MQWRIKEHVFGPTSNDTACIHHSNSICVAIRNIQIVRYKSTELRPFFRALSRRSSNRNRKGASTELVGSSAMMDCGFAEQASAMRILWKDTPAEFMWIGAEDVIGVFYADIFEICLRSFLQPVWRPLGLDSRLHRHIVSLIREIGFNDCAGSWKTYRIFFLFYLPQSMIL